MQLKRGNWRIKNPHYILHCDIVPYIVIRLGGSWGLRPTIDVWTDGGRDGLPDRCIGGIDGQINVTRPPAVFPPSR